jgi:hypothetical protein
MLGHQPKAVTFDARDLRAGHIEQSCGAFSNGSQRRLKIGW